MKIIAPAAFLLVATLFSVIGMLPHRAEAYTCTNLQTPATAVPAGYGAAYNPLGSTKEYLVSAACSGSATNATVTVGNGNSTTYVYNKGYHYTGSAWQQFTLSCSNLVSNTWCVGRGTVSVPLPQNPTNVIGYTCQWNGAEWKCGCRNSACNNNERSWQLQRVSYTDSGSTPPLTSSSSIYNLCGNFVNAGYRGGAKIPTKSATAGRSYPAGRHTITGKIVLGSNEVLSGAGSDKTTLYFPNGLTEIEGYCDNPKDCWSWNGGLITATGREIGIQNVTIEFPPHTFTHYDTTLGAQPGYNGVQFRNCQNCWAKDVRVINSDAGFLNNNSQNVTIENTSVTANANGSHIHYSISSSDTSNILVNNFTTYNTSEHGLTAQWGALYGVYTNGTLVGPTRLEPEHNGPAAYTLYKDIQGNVKSVQTTRRTSYGGGPVNSTMININGKNSGIPCTENHP